MLDAILFYLKSEPHRYVSELVAYQEIHIKRGKGTAGDILFSLKSGETQNFREV